MANGIGKRFLKAIRRKITNVLKRRVANNQATEDVVVEPVHENRPSAKPARLFPFSKRTQNLNGATTPSFQAYSATPSGSEKPSIVLPGEVDTQEPQVVSGEVAEAETLKSKENDIQGPPGEAKNAQKQRERRHKINPIYRQERALPTSTTLNIGQTVQATGEGTPVTNLDTSPKRPEATTPTEQHTEVAGRLDAVIVDERQDQTNVPDPQPPSTNNTSSTPTDTSTNCVRVKASRALRKQQRLATTHGSPVIFKVQDMTYFTLIKEARGHHTRVCRVRGAAESYARAFGQEAAPRKRLYVVMGCAFNAVLGILMVNLCAIVSLKHPEPGQASRVSNRNNRLIPIAPNKPNPKASPAQAHFGDDGVHFGNYSWIDARKVYNVPVDLIKEDPYASLKLCKCSWEKLRETLAMGTSAEETFGIEREFKRFQRKTRAGGVGQDHNIRMADSIPQLQPQTEPGEAPRPRLRRYQVEELLHFQ